MRFLQIYLIEPLTNDIFDYKSRTGRKQYWLFMLSLSVVYLFLSLTKFLVDINSPSVSSSASFIFATFTLLVFVAAFLANISIKIRRLNDIEKSPFYILLLLLPVIGEAAFIFFMVKPSAGKKTAPPRRTKIAIFTFLTAALITTLFFWNIMLIYKTVKRAQIPWYTDRAVTKAVEAASPSDLKNLLNPFTKLELRDADNNTALIYALRKHPVKELLKIFIDLKADINAALPNGDTPLYIAIAKSADLDTIKFLIDNGASVNTENGKNITPLMVAVKRGNEKTVALLLLNGAATTNGKGQNVADWAKPVNPITKALLELADNKEKDSAYKNTIYADVLAGKDVSESLLSLPPAPAAPAPSQEEKALEEQKQNALKLIGNLPEAFKNADKGWAKKMVSKGLSMGKISDGGQTALMYAAMLSSDTDVLDIFINAGADVNAKDDNGVSVLTWAAAVNPDIDIAEFLIEKGADVNAVNKKDISVLGFAAIQAQNPEVIDLLVEHGADVNYQGAGGGTPLIYAALFNTNEEIVETLIKNGADVKAKDDGGTPVINYAADNKNPKVLSIIRSSMLK